MWAADHYNLALPPPTLKWKLHFFLGTKTNKQMKKKKQKNKKKPKWWQQKHKLESTHQETGQQQQQQQQKPNQIKQTKKIKIKPNHPTIKCGGRTCDSGL